MTAQLQLAESAEVYPAAMMTLKEIGAEENCFPYSTQ